MARDLLAEQPERRQPRDLLAPEPADSRDSALGRIDAAVRGAADAFTLGTADEIAASLNSGSLFGLNEGLWGNYDQALAEQRAIDAADAENRGGYRLAGQLAGGVAGASGLARAGLLASVNAANAGRGLGRVALGSAGEGAVLGGAHGFGSGEGAGNRLSGAASGAAVGSMLGLAAPYAVAGAAGLGRRAVTPFAMSPERVAAAETLRREGVPLTAGQITGSRGLRFAESELGGNRAADLMGKQEDAFTAAVLRRAGIDSNRATPEVIDEAFRSIGRQFDDLAANSQIVPDQEMAVGLRDVLDSYTQTVPESLRAPIVENVARDIVDAASRGPVSGEMYKNLTSRLARAARGASNPDLRQALYGIREVLDDAMERSMAAVDPAMVGAWRNAREQYRNLLAIEQAATRAGEKAAEGIITPANIRNAAVNQGRRAYARGQGDFADLARSGSMLMAPLPDSGTAGRLNAQNLGAGITSILGAGAGASAGGPIGAAMGAAVGAGVPRVAGALLLSRPMQAYLSNQLLSEGLSPQARAVAAALLNAQIAPEAGRRRLLEIPAP
ncbi:MAG TPA: hypothetical protein VIK75_10070 [Calditerricola sp.]